MVTDRPAQEIEVTDAMVAAGVDALAGHFIGIAEARPESERAAVRDVFSRMAEAQRKADL
jgi:hypothetical protein